MFNWSPCTVHATARMYISFEKNPKIFNFQIFGLRCLLPIIYIRMSYTKYLFSYISNLHNTNPDIFTFWIFGLRCQFHDWMPFLSYPNRHYCNHDEIFQLNTLYASIELSLKRKYIVICYTNLAVHCTVLFWKGFCSESP